MEREAFLARVRRRVGSPPPANLPHPLPVVEDVPEIRYKRDLSDRVEAFERAATRVGAVVRRGLPLDELLQAHPAARAVVSRDPETDGIAEMLRGAGVDVVGFDSAHAIAGADLGVTGAGFGIAATGTLVVDPGRAGGRTASLLPPVHLALVRAGSILPDAGALFRRMRDHFPAGPPSQLVLITGPSRSADIEMTLTVGVHGPRSLWIGILEGP